MKYRRLFPLPVLAALLAACGDDGAPKEGQVTGEVLEGSISDEMLPLDQVRSEAPLADPAATGESTAPSGRRGASEAGSEAEEPSEDEQPAQRANETE